ncbi:MAG: DUF2934 domain-containing protein [Sulfuritalea sp.]|nr:DUF2934 domain-containing protein [Sulfuritalea sp.]
MASPKSTTKTSAKRAVAKPAVPAKAPKSVVAAKAKTVVKEKPPVKAGVATKPTTKKLVADKAVAKAAAETSARKSVSVAAKQPKAVSGEQRRYYVEVAAYHIAERRGFAPGNPLDDWVQAEAEIERLLAAGLLGS